MERALKPEVKKSGREGEDNSTRDMRFEIGRDDQVEA